MSPALSMEGGIFFPRGVYIALGAEKVIKLKPEYFGGIIVPK